MDGTLLAHIVDEVNVHSTCRDANESSIALERQQSSNQGSIGALLLTYTILEVLHNSYSAIYPKTLFD